MLYIEDELIAPYFRTLKIEPFLRSNLPVNRFRDAKYLEWHRRLRKFPTAIYLDTNFWIMLREGERASPGSILNRLFRKFLSLKLEQRIICPVTQETFFEIQKQADDRSRFDTFAIVDTLSEGFGIASAWEQSQEEVRQIAQALRHGKRRIGQKLPWRKGGILLGQLYIDPWEIHPVERRGLQNWFFEGYSRIPFTILDQSIGRIGPEIFEEKFATYIEEATPIKNAASREYSSKEQIRALEYSVPILAQVNRITSIEHMDASFNYGVEEIQYMKRMARDLRGRAPVHAAYSDLTALHRQDLRKNTGVNDIYDLFHAAVAIACCDYFFTEKHMLDQVERVVAGDASHHLQKAVFRPEDALEILETL